MRPSPKEGSRRGRGVMMQKMEGLGGFMLVPTVSGQCHSVVVKSAGPRTDSSGSYSGNTACGLGQVA